MGKAVTMTRRGARFAFDVFFLDQATLQTLPSESHLGATYADLLRNRVDPAPFRHIEDPAEREAAIDASRMRRRLRAAVLLFRNEAYHRVARLEAPSLYSLQQWTRSRGEPWWAVAGLPGEVVGEPGRSLGTFDIIYEGDQPYLVMPLGLIDMRMGTYLTPAGEASAAAG
ncbi:MAG TPA: hypothetical protein DD491_12345 [Halieaceae bacterium]|nr:hypothetical protein [Halieaceae bacterium]